MWYITGKQNLCDDENMKPSANPRDRTRSDYIKQKDQNKKKEFIPDSGCRFFTGP